MSESEKSKYIADEIGMFPMFSHWKQLLPDFDSTGFRFTPILLDEYGMWVDGEIPVEPPLNLTQKK